MQHPRTITSSAPVNSPISTDGPPLPPKSRKQLSRYHLEDGYVTAQVHPSNLNQHGTRNPLIPASSKTVASAGHHVEEPYVTLNVDPSKRNQRDVTRARILKKGPYGDYNNDDSTRRLSHGRPRSQSQPPPNTAPERVSDSRSALSSPGFGYRWTNATERPKARTGTYQAPLSFMPSVRPASQNSERPQTRIVTYQAPLTQPVAPVRPASQNSERPKTRIVTYQAPLSFTQPIAPVRPASQNSYTRPKLMFYHKQDPYYGFTNFSPHPVTYMGKEYPTSEHLFQSFKFHGHKPGLAEHIRTCSTRPSVAFSEAKRFQPEVRPDWLQINIKMMEEALRLKFDQHPNLKAELLSTGNMELIEASDKDGFWGWGADHCGRNELGKALERLRAKLVLMRRDAYALPNPHHLPVALF